MSQDVLRKPEAPVNDGDNYKLTIVVKKFDYMLETLRIFRYLGVQHLSDNLKSVQPISRKDVVNSARGKS